MGYVPRSSSGRLGSVSLLIQREACIDRRRPSAHHERTTPNSNFESQEESRQLDDFQGARSKVEVAVKDMIL